MISRLILTSSGAVSWQVSPHAGRSQPIDRHKSAYPYVMRIWTVLAEFSLASGSQTPGHGGGVEWYESAGRSDYSFDTPGPSSSAAATYGTFEDEPPLLEGVESFLLAPSAHTILLLCSVLRLSEAFAAANAYTAVAQTVNAKTCLSNQLPCSLCRVGHRHHRHLAEVNLHCQQQNA